MTWSGYRVNWIVLFLLLVRTIEAQDRSQIFTTETASLITQSLPYESNWFRLLVAVLAIGALRRLDTFERFNSAGNSFCSALSPKILQSQAVERARIAGELHDGLGQRLALIKNMALLPNRSASLNGRGQLEEIAAEASNAARRGAANLA